jgi:hypothetical protein
MGGLLTCFCAVLELDDKLQKLVTKHSIDASSALGNNQLSNVDLQRRIVQGNTGTYD